MSKGFLKVLVIVAVLGVGGPLLVGRFWPQLQVAYWTLRTMTGSAHRTDVVERDVDGDGVRDVQVISSKGEGAVRAVQEKAAAAARRTAETARPVHFEGTRACTQADLSGSWNLIMLSNYGVVQKNAMHERFVFYDDGFMSHTASTNPIDEEMAKILSVMPRSVRYTLYPNGILQVDHPDMPGQPSFSLCSCVTEDRPTMKKGDVILTITDDQGKTAAGRLLRKIS